MFINCVAWSAQLRITVKIHVLCSAFDLVRSHMTRVMDVRKCSCTPRDPAAMCPRHNGKKGMVIAFALFAHPKLEQDVIAPKQRQMQEARDRRQWLVQARRMQEAREMCEWEVARGGRQGGCRRQLPWSHHGSSAQS